MLDMFWVHTVTTQTRTGQNANGDVYSDPVDVVGWLQDGAHLIRNSQGDEVVSQTVFYTQITNADLFTADTIVTTPTRTARVVTVIRNDGGNLPLASYAEIHLT